MKHRAAGIALFLAGFALRADIPPSQTQPLPTPFPPARYGQMSAKSPFAVATATGPQAAPTPGFASNLYVTGVARIGASEYVSIKTRGDDKAVKFLEVGKPDADGLKVDRVDWSDEIGKSKAEVSKAGEKATLGFDEDAMAKPAVAQSGLITPRGPGMPMMPGANFPRPRMGNTLIGPGADQPRIQMRRRNIIQNPP